MIEIETTQQHSRKKVVSSGKTDVIVQKKKYSRRNDGSFKRKKIESFSFNPAGQSCATWPAFFV